MPSLIVLKPSQRRCRHVSNMLVVNAEPLTPEAVEVKCELFLSHPTAANRDEAILAFRSCVRHITGRWLHSFPSVRTMEDDLVQVGMEVVIKSIDGLKTSEDATRVITNRVHSAQTAYVNQYRSTTAPSVWSQRKRLAAGEEVIYSELFKEGDDYEDANNMDMHQLEFVDLVVHAIQDDLDEAIMDPMNWGSPVREIAERLNVSKSLVGTRLKRMKHTIERELNVKH